MKNLLTNLKLPVLISLLLVIPFMVMEAVNTQNLNAVFNITAKPVTLVISIVFLVLIAPAWSGIVADPMPCFLGVPNCD